MEPTYGPQTAKLTGMFLQLSDAEVIEMIRDPAALTSKVQEAITLLEQIVAQ
jgi:hypothetical protein